jgi:hypothetical protein
VSTYGSYGPFARHGPSGYFLDSPKQLALADVFRDATAVIDALGYTSKRIFV